MPEKRVDKMSDHSELLLLFQKPFEPFYTPKEDVDGNGTVEFIVPQTYQTERYDDMVYHSPPDPFLGAAIPQYGIHTTTSLPENASTTSTSYKQALGAVSNTISTIFDPILQPNKRTIIKIEPIDLPDVSFAKKLQETDGFSLFNETHMGIAGRLTRILIDIDSSKLFRMAAYARNELNPFLFQYAFSVALQHRQDTGHIVVPNIVTIFPNHFVASSAMLTARKELVLYEDWKRKDIDLEVNFTATDKESEQRMAYFREG